LWRFGNYGATLMQDTDIPYKFSTVWGASAGSGYLTAVIPPTAVGGAASQVLGFPPITATAPGAGGIPPDIADFNGVLNYLSAWSQWAQAGGPIYYDAAFSTAIGGYPKGAVLAKAATLGQFWISTVDNNMSDPDTGGSNWNNLLPYAAINGDASQVFNVANAITSTEAIALGQITAAFGASGKLVIPSYPNNIVVIWDTQVGPFGTSPDVSFTLTFPFGGFPMACNIVIPAPYNPTQITGLGQSMLEFVSATSTVATFFSDQIFSVGSLGIAGVVYIAIGH
jgi:hypothetical protein